jgi:hypothetical protein
MLNTKVLSGALAVALVVAIAWPDKVRQLFGGGPTVEDGFVMFVQKQNELTVSRSGMVSIVRTHSDGLIDSLDTETYVIVPGSVRYTVQPAQIGRNDFRWDADQNMLSVTVPDPTPTDINVDGARARVLLDGVDLQSGDKRQRIVQQSLQEARRDMAERSRNQELLRFARDSAREALQANFAAPMLAAGLNPKIVVRFRSEAAPAIAKG